MDPIFSINTTDGTLTLELLDGETFNSTNLSDPGTVLTIGTVDTATGVITFTVSHQYLDDGLAPGNNTPDDESTIDAVVTDKDDAFDDDSETVTVNNVAPTVDAIVGPAEAVQGQPVAFEGSSSDVGTLDTHTLEWEVTRIPDSTANAVLCDEFGKPQMLTMLYTGDDIVSHSQDPSKVNVTDDLMGDEEVFIRASDKEDPNAGNAKVWFTGLVSLDNTFEIDATNAGENKLKSKTFVHIYSEENGTLLQTIEFHTSCSQPLFLGDQFGGIQLTGYLSENGAGDIFVIDPFPSDYESRVENIRKGEGPILDGTGIMLVANVTVFDDDVPDKLEGKKGRDWFFARDDGSADEDDLKKLELDEIVDLLI